MENGLTFSTKDNKPPVYKIDITDIGFKKVKVYDVDKKKCEPVSFSFSTKDDKRLVINKRRKRNSIFLYIASVLVLAVGGYLIYNGLQPKYLAAPFPAATIQADDNQGEVGNEGLDPTKVNNPDYEKMQVDSMEDGSIFIPEIGAYSQIVPEGIFETSDYAGFYSIAIPDNAQKSFWFKDGAPLVGGYEGTTLVGGHYGYNNNPGAFRDLYETGAGNIIWTKDFDGNIQKWQVTNVYYKYHTDFPQEFWDKDGIRRLVVTTCAGNPDDGGRFSNNIFVIAKPIPSKFDDAVSNTAFEKPEESQSMDSSQSGEIDGPQSNESEVN